MLTNIFKKPVRSKQDQATGRDRFNLREFRKNVQQTILRQRDGNKQEERRVSYQYNTKERRKKEKRQSRQLEQRSMANESLISENQVHIPNFLHLKDKGMKRKLSLSKESFNPKKPVSKQLRDQSNISRLSVNSFFTKNQETISQAHFLDQRSSPKLKPRKTKIIGINGLDQLKKEVSLLHQSPLPRKSRSPQQKNSHGTKEIMNSINSLKKRFEKGRSSVGKEKELRRSFVQRDENKALRASPVSRKIGSIKMEFPLTRIRDLQAFFEATQPHDIEQLDPEYVSALVNLTSPLTSKIRFSTAYR